MENNFLKNWFNYYKDNPKGYWFKRKLYGWGWMPVRWEGWVVMLLYIGTLFYFATKIDKTQHSVSDALLNFAPVFIAVSIIFLAIVYKTGQRPKWQWGKEIE